MEKSYILISVVVVNMVILGLVFALKARKLGCSGRDPGGQATGSQKLMMGVMAFIGVVVFVTVITLYFVRQGGGLGG